jgi:hypothetical protein
MLILASLQSTQVASLGLLLPLHAQERARQALAWRTRQPHPAALRCPALGHERDDIDYRDAHVVAAIDVNRASISPWYCMVRGERNPWLNAGFEGNNLFCK